MVHVLSKSNQDNSRNFSDNIVKFMFSSERMINEWRQIKQDIVTTDYLIMSHSGNLNIEKL